MENTILHGDCNKIMEEIPSGHIQMCVTSPPYFGLRDYGIKEQIGLEETLDEYIAKLVHVFRHLKRIMKDNGTLWLNLGDSYSHSSKGQKDTKKSSRLQMSNAGTQAVLPIYKPKNLSPKNLLGIPWKVAFALQADGWILRSDIIWSKPNPMPESVTDRPTKSHEYIFLFSKSTRYLYNLDQIRERVKPTTNGISAVRPSLDSKLRDKKHWMLHTEPNVQAVRKYATIKGANKRSVWEVPTKSINIEHFATFPENLIKPCILAGSNENDIVFDPFFGAGTTGYVALKYKRKYLGIEINQKYIDIANRRLAGVIDEIGLF